MNGVDSNTKDGWRIVETAMNGAVSKREDP
jgi:hypothetical protein